MGRTVDRTTSSVENIQNTVRNAVINQVNNFASAGAEAADTLNAALRQGRLAVEGGVR